MTIFAFMADVSEPDRRIFRMGMAHISLVIAGPLAPLIGTLTNNMGGYILTFATQVTLNVMAIIMLYLTTRRLKSTRDSNKKWTISGLLHPNHIMECIRVLLKKRQGPYRKLIFITCLIYILKVVTITCEGALGYLYVGIQFGWQVKEFNTYHTVTNGLDSLIQMGVLSLITSWEPPEGKLFMVCFANCVLCVLIKGFSFYPWLYYIGMW